MGAGHTCDIFLNFSFVPQFVEFSSPAQARPDKFILQLAIALFHIQ
jgi:hypothetical protein